MFTPTYTQIWGCECCIVIKQLPLILNSWRKIKIKITYTRSSNEYFSTVFSNNDLLHNRHDDAMKEMMCPLAEGTIFPKNKSVLRIYDSCPLYNVYSYERNITSEAHTIKFHTYMKFTSCSVHALLGEGSLSCDVCRESDETKGKIRTKKVLTMKEVTIGKFMFVF